MLTTRTSEIKCPTKRKIENLLVEGGGIRGLYHLGAFLALEEFLPDLLRVGGSSIGALMTCNLAFGHHPREIIARTRARQRAGKLPHYLDFIPEDTRHFFDVTKADSHASSAAKSIYNTARHAFLFAKNAVNVPLTAGIYHGRHIEKEVISIIHDSQLDPVDKKKDMTFLELHHLIKKYPHLYLKDLYVTSVDATHIDKYEPVIFSWETTPHMPIRIAIHASMAVPFLFKPVHYNGRIFIDGGIFNNLPIHMFDHIKYMEEGCLLVNGMNMRTLGVSLSSKNRMAKVRDNVNTESKESAITSFVKHVKKIPFLPLIKQEERLKAGCDPVRIIFVDSSEVDIFDFKILEDTLDGMIEDGSAPTKEYIKLYIENVEDPHVKTELGKNMRTLWNAYSFLRPCLKDKSASSTTYKKHH